MCLGSLTIYPDGKEIVIVGDADFVTRVNAYLERIRATDIGANIIAQLDASNEKVFIKEVFFIKSSGYDQKSNELYLGSVLPFSDKLEGGSIDEFLALTHEIRHAFSDFTNSDGIFNNTITSRANLEYTAVYFTNYVRSVYGYDRFRLKYSGIGLKTNSKVVLLFICFLTLKM